MQIEQMNGTTKTLENLSPEEVMEEMAKAMADEQTKEVRVYPRYAVVHEGLNRQQRRDIKFGRAHRER